MNPPGTPYPSNAVVVSASAACGRMNVVPTELELHFSDPTIWLPCTVEVRLANGAGSSPARPLTSW